MARRKVQYSTGSRAVYNKFKTVHPEIDISYIAWNKLIRTFNTNYMEYILETGEKVKIPYGLGPLAISKKKVKKFSTLPDGREVINLPVDWAKTKKAGKWIFHMNDHTDGHRCKWYWWPDEARFTLSECWVFRPCRIASRKITAYIRKDIAYLHKYKSWQRGY